MSHQHASIAIVAFYLLALLPCLVRSQQDAEQISNTAAFLSSASSLSSQLPEIHLNRIDALEYSLKPSVQTTSKLSSCPQWTKSRALIKAHIQTKVVEMAQSEEAKRGSIRSLMQSFVNPPVKTCFTPDVRATRLAAVDYNVSGVVAAHQNLFDTLASQSHETVSPLWEQFTTQADDIAPGSSLKERQRSLIRRLRESLLRGGSGGSTRRQLAQVNLPNLTPAQYTEWMNQLSEHQGSSPGNTDLSQWTHLTSGDLATQIQQLSRAVNRTTSFFVFLAAVRNIVVMDQLLANYGNCLVASTPRTCGATRAAPDVNTAADGIAPLPGQTLKNSGGAEHSTNSNTMSSGTLVMIVIGAIVATNIVTLFVVRHVHKQKLQSRASNPFTQVATDEPNESASAPPAATTVAVVKEEDEV